MFYFMLFLFFSCACLFIFLFAAIYNAAWENEQLAALTLGLAIEDDSNQHRRRRRRCAAWLTSSDEERVSGADNGGFLQGLRETFPTHSRLQASFAVPPEPLVSQNSTSSRSTDVPFMLMNSEHSGSSAMPASSVQGQTCREGFTEVKWVEGALAVCTCSYK